MPDTKLRGDLLLKEYERKSNDQLRVYNPTDTDFKFKYGGQLWLVPNKGKDIGYGMGQNIFVRYVAVSYMSKMTDHMINTESDKIVSARKAVYNGNDWPGEELRVALRTNNIELRKKYMTQLYKGIDRKFGMLEMVTEEPEKEIQATSRPVDYDILESLEELEAGNSDLNVPTTTSSELDFINQISQ